MTVKELTEIFEMSAKALADHIGYSRQALYDIVDECKPVNTRRFKASCKLLLEWTINQRNIEVKKAQEKYERRVKALEELFKEVLGGG